MKAGIGSGLIVEAAFMFGINQDGGNYQKRWVSHRREAISCRPGYT